MILCSFQCTSILLLLNIFLSQFNFCLLQAPLKFKPISKKFSSECLVIFIVLCFFDTLLSWHMCRCACCPPSAPTYMYSLGSQASSPPSLSRYQTFFIFISNLVMESHFWHHLPTSKIMCVLVKSRFVAFPINVCLDYRLHQLVSSSF